MGRRNFPRKNRQNGRRRRLPRNKTRRGPSSHDHSTSIVVGTITLKRTHRKQEVYPVPLNDLITRANVGTDADIRAVGYSLQLTLATGNRTETVTANIAHSGPWVRRGTSSDIFNQQFTEHTFRNNQILFRKKVLAEAEREYINPDTDQNHLDIRIRDPCGVIPGVVIRYEARFHLIRPVPSTFFQNANETATDRYEDQDVNGASVQPPPSGSGSDVPYQLGVQYQNQAVVTVTPSSNSTPTELIFDYSSGPNLHIKITSTPMNKAGIFIIGEKDDLNTLRTKYQQQGYEGTLTLV